MRRLLHLGAGAFPGDSGHAGLALRRNLPPFAVTSVMPDPQDGRVSSGVYTNAYFGVLSPPEGFAEDWLDLIRRIPATTCLRASFRRLWAPDQS
jgi:hypothetical protein